MANLFAQPEGSSNLFDSVVETEEQAQAPLQPQAVGRAARLAAFANADITKRGAELVEQMDSLTTEYEGLIEQYGDNTVRREAASRQQVRELRGLNDLMQAIKPVDEDGSVQRDIITASQAVVLNDVQQREKFALEQEAVEKIQDLAAGGDYVQAKLLMNNLELGDANERLRDIDTKRLILMREIEKAQISKEDQGWFSDAADFILDFLPLNRSMGRGGNVEIADGLKNWYDGLYSGKRVRNEAASLWNMDPASFSDYVRDELIPNIRDNSTLLGVHSNSEQLDLLTSMANTPAEWQVGFEDAINNVGLVPSLKTLKGLTTIPSLLVRQGARKEASETIAKTMLEMATEGVDASVRKNGLELDDVIDNTAPTSVNIGGKVSGVPLAAEVSAEIDRANALVAMLPEIQATGRFFNDLEAEQAFTKTLKRLETEFGRELKDVKVLSRPVADLKTTTLGDQSQVHQIELTLGKKDGSGFTRERDARNFANSLGYDTADVFRDDSGQWFTTIKRDFAETGFYTNPLKVQEDSVAWRLLRGARQVGDLDLADMAQVGGNKRAAFLKQVVQPQAQKFSKLKKWEREAITQVISAGSNAEKWFGTDELNTLIQRTYKRNATQAEQEAYQAYRDINNIEWALRNDDVYKSKVLQGFETASFNTPLYNFENVNVMVNRSLDHVPPNRVYNVNEGIHYTKQSRLTTSDLERFKAEGYVLVNVEDAVTLSDGTKVKTFLIKGRDISLRPLERQQVAYRPGGHRMYKDKYFAKQARKGRQPDTGEEFLQAPGTFIAGTKKEVEQWTGKMELARQRYNAMKQKGYVDPDEIDEIFEGDAAFPTAREFIGGMTDGTYHPDAPFETLFDRELPAVYNNVDAGDLEFIQGEDGFNGYLRTNGRMYYSRRGEQLRDYRGNLAPTLDPFQTVNKALTNIANITSFSDYKLTAMERWVKQFKDFTNLKDLPPGASDMTIFRDAVVNTNNDRIKQKALAQRNIIRRNLGWKSEHDIQSEQFTRRLHEWVFTAEPGSLGSKIEGSINDWWDNKNPIMALRGMAFDMKLGLFNIAQFPLQIGTSLAATTLSPIHGAHGWITAVPLRAYLTRSGTDHMLDTLVDRGLHKASGFSTEHEFKQFMKSAKQSGFFDIGGSHALINDYGPNAAVSDFTGRVNRFREAGRFFFNEAEMWNRAIAYHIAWKETRGAFPELGTKSPEFLRKVAGRAEDYSFGMSEQSGAVWQKGLLSVPTQFWAYQARMMEALLGKTFTPEQRLRLAIGQTLLWGSAGLPVLPWLSEKYKESVAPEQFGGQPFDSFFKVADRGLFDWALYNMTGADVLVGKKAGTGSWLVDTIRDIFGFGQYGERSFAEIAGGATFNIMGQAGGTLLEVINHMMSEAGADTGEPVKPEALKRLAMNISTASNAVKAYYVFNYGTYISNKGTVIADNMPTEAGLAAILGFQPGEYDQVEAAMAYNKNETELVNEAAKIVGNYRTRMINEPENRQSIAEEIQAFTMQFPPEVRQRILRKTNREYDASLYSSLERQMQERKQRIPEE